MIAIDNTKILATIAACRQHGLKLATVESCTGGLIASHITAVAGCSDIFEGAFVTYSNEAKTMLVGVQPNLIAKNGAVSPQVATAMAEGALKHSHANIAISVTGIAGPGGQSIDKPLGLVHFAIAQQGHATAHHEERFGDLGRANVRHSAVNLACHLLLNHLKLINCE